MNQEELKRRTKKFAIRIIKLVDALPKNVVGRVIANQLMKCGTSVGANDRAACRGRSKAEFSSKLAIVIEEADESIYWMELIIESKLLPESRTEPLLREANEITAIMVASRKTAKK